MHKPRRRRKAARNSRRVIDPPRANSVPVPMPLLLDVVDEMHLIASVLRCIPDLERLEDLADQIHDPVGKWFRLVGEVKPALVRPKHDGAGTPECVDINGCAGAAVHAAAWQIERIAFLLEAVLARPSIRNRANDRTTRP